MQAKALGCQRVVAAREMSSEELRKLCRLPIEVEVFVHGALCMSVSGQCAFSALVGGRSANRGRCAQACRLPWQTPGGQNPAALSLKDLSLVQHMEQLRNMGVASFKIEGRMKRPEYVAASVTALRMALEGQPPDLETLRAVFARSGFTDGYFTGRKKEMFGSRRKEDVLAAQKVLQELQNTYRKPRKVSQVDFSMHLEPQKPAELTAWDQDGNSVTVYGSTPQTAVRTPLELPMLRKQLQKLGDTIFDGGTTELHNPEQLAMTAAQCNAMRRDAVTALYNERAFRNQKRYTVTEPWQMAIREKQLTGRPALRLHVHGMPQLKSALSTEHIICVPLKLTDACEPTDQIWIEAPRIIADEADYTQKLAELQQRGFRHLLCHNLADIRIGGRLGFRLHGGYGLNCTNQRTARVLESQGLLDVTGSYELRLSGITALGSVLPSGAYVYGRLPMMLLRLCPIRAQDGCRRKDCFLKDRTGQRFPLICSDDYTELCNARILWIADKKRQLQYLDYWDLYFTTETPTQMRRVLEDYLCEAPAVPENRTNGMYFKGGLA